MLLVVGPVLGTYAQGESAVSMQSAVANLNNQLERAHAAAKKCKHPEDPCEVGKHLGSRFARSIAMFVVMNHKKPSEGKELVSSWIGQKKYSDFDQKCFDKQFEKRFKPYYDKYYGESKHGCFKKIHKVRSCRKIAKQPKSEIKKDIKILQKKLKKAKPEQKRRIRLDIVAHKKAIVVKEIKETP